MLAGRGSLAIASLQPESGSLMKEVNAFGKIP
jgi:hypothetical protein